jgi:VPDSG-CTERM motif
MRKLFLTTILTGFMGASVALAIPGSGTITMTGGDFEYSDGGEFTATVAGFPSFQTFCIEIQHEFTLGGTYNYTLGQDTHGAPPSTASPVLNLGTAWLFSQFGAGHIAIGSTTQAGEFQAALWYFQGQGVNGNGAFSGPGFGDGLPGANAYTDEAITALTGLGLDALDPSNGKFFVSIIESSNANGAPAQDWLYVPDGGTTVVLLGIGLMGLVLVSRRFAIAR